MRTATHELSEGFGTARWGDDAETLCQLHPECTWLDSYEGRNPLTGEPVSVPPMLRASAFIRLGSGASLDASFEIGPRGLRAIHLTPAQSDDSADLRENLTHLAGMLQVEVKEEVGAQSWVARGARVELEQDGAWFVLIIHSPT